jgi:hypothetical protein
MPKKQITQKELREITQYVEGNLILTKSKYKPQLIGLPLGTTGKNGYLATSLRGTAYTIHRLVFLYHHGYFPEQVDHENGNRLDNRIENLREATHQQNCYNKRKVAGKSSKYKGVSRFSNGKWLAYIDHKGIRYHLGYYATEEEAAKAYDLKATSFFKEYAKLNIEH